MRIAFVAAGGFDRSGRERVIPSLVSLVERLARQHEVVAYVLRYHQTPCRYELAGATICDLGRPQGLIAQYRALTRAMRTDGRFDIVHAYWPLPAGRVATIAAARFRLPSVVTFDSGEFVALPDIGYGLQRGWRNRLGVTFTARLATQVTVCSHFQEALARAHGVGARVIPLGVDTATFTGRVAPTEGPPFRLLHVASLNRVKDQATLLRAMQLLCDQSLPVTLDIVGEDTMNGALQALVRELGLTDAVTFHGFLTSDQLVPLYHRAHLFVLTSLHEAAGVVVLEAAACGVPVVGSAVGYLADWSGARAEAVAPGDAASLAHAITRLLADPVRRRDMAAAASVWARQHDADFTARAFDAVYREAISRHAR